MSRTAYIGSTIFVTDKKFLFPYIGQNGDTAFVINPETKKILAEFTKYDREWVPVNTGDGSGTVLELDEIESAIEVLQGNVDTVATKANSNLAKIAALTEESASTKSAVENIQSAYVKSIEVDNETGQLVITKQDNNIVSIDLETNGAGTLSSDDLNQMWGD